MTKAFGAARAAAAFFLLASPALAQGPAAAPAAAPDIARPQAEEMMKAMFAQVDANGDGVIDQAESKAVIEALKTQGAPAAAVAHFQTVLNDADTAKDGKITLAAFLKVRMAAFDKGDTNHDGKLDAKEQAALRAAVESKK